MRPWRILALDEAWIRGPECGRHDPALSSIDWPISSQRRNRRGWDDAEAVFLRSRHFERLRPPPAGLHTPLKSLPAHETAHHGGWVHTELVDQWIKWTEARGETSVKRDRGSSPGTVGQGRGACCRRGTPWLARTSPDRKAGRIGTQQHTDGQGHGHEDSRKYALSRGCPTGPELAHF